MDYLGAILKNSNEFTKLYQQYNAANEYNKNLYPKMESYINAVIEESDQISVDGMWISDRDDQIISMTFEIIFRHPVLGQYKLHITESYDGREPQEGVSLIADINADSKEFIDTETVLEDILEYFL